MKTIITMCIEDNGQERVQTIPGAEQTEVCIHAGSLQKAMLLVLREVQGEIATEEPGTTKTSGTYSLPTMTNEYMDKRARDYEASKEGQRFLKTLQKSLDFVWKNKNGKAGQSLTQTYYMACRHHNNLLNGSAELAALAYRQGYNAAKHDARKQSGRQ